MMLGTEDYPLARIGRKRKLGTRTKSGRLNVRRQSDDHLMAMQPHRRDLPAADRMSPKAITTLGQLNLTRRISDAQYEAGERYREVVNRYRAVIGSIDPLMAPQWGSWPLSDDEAKNRTEAYNDAYMVVWRSGQAAAKWVSRVAVYDETCPISAFPELVCGLQALAVHFGLVRRWGGVGNGRN